MFKYEKKNYEVNTYEDEFYYKVMMCHAFKIFSPFEVTDIDFPKKEKYGGVVLKFAGSGSAYFKVQREMPNQEEVRFVLETCKFLKEKYGEYVVACIICESHIEISDIELPNENIEIHYGSMRKNDGDKTLKILTDKLENKEKFNIENHILRIFLPFMSHIDDEEFQSKYSKFNILFHESKMKLPSFNELLKANIYFKHHW